VKTLSLRYNIPVDTHSINLRDLFLPLIPPPFPLLAERPLKPDEPEPSAVLLVVSSYYAALCGAKILYHAVTSEDQSVVPKINEISEKVVDLVKLNLGIADFDISIPYFDKTHREVLNILMRNDSEAETWSCNWGGPYHCGMCAGCLVRKERFSKSTYEDTTQYSIDYSS